MLRLVCPILFLFSSLTFSLFFVTLVAMKLLDPKETDTNTRTHTHTPTHTGKLNSLKAYTSLESLQKKKTNKRKIPSIDMEPDTDAG